MQGGMVVSSEISMESLDNWSVNLKKFSWTELESLTGDFSDDRLIGYTIFGKVYRGFSQQGREVTVKTWHAEKNSRMAKANEARFNNEVSFLTNAKVRHKSYLPKLLGYFHENNEDRVLADNDDLVLAVVYDLRSKDTLLNLTKQDDFTWIQRITAALGLARLLEDLHTQEPHYMVRNLDVSHVMLDQDENPTLVDLSMVTEGKEFRIVIAASDFSKVTTAAVDDHFETSDYEASFHICDNAYIDSRVLFTGLWFLQNDVFSFGSILLGLMGKHVFNNIEDLRLYFQSVDAEYELKSECDCKILGCLYVHNSLKQELGYYACLGAKITELALGCVQRDMKLRPTMAGVVQTLEDCFFFCSLRLNEVPYDGYNTDVATEEFTSKESFCGLLKFSWRDLGQLTESFSEHNFIGETLLGDVYRGKTQQGQDITVKVGCRKSRNTDYSSFKNDNSSRLEKEIFFLSNSQVRDAPYFVKLMGYCSEGDNFGVVYNLKPRDTLHNFIEKDDFTWFGRIKAAIHIARALEALHSKTPPYLVRYIDTAHVMLDQCLNAILFDFSVLTDGAIDDKRNGEVVSLFGCRGYVDPTSIEDGTWNEKSDVFSFGVILLSLLSKCNGMKNESRLLYEWAKQRYKAKKFKLPYFFGSSKLLSKHVRCSLVHKSMMEDPDFDGLIGVEVEKLALRCVSYDKQKRPTMTEIVQILEKHEDGLNMPYVVC